MGIDIKAIWQGGFKQGNGKLSIENSGLDGVNFKPFFAKSDGTFTNPEELLASAHATCYAMTFGYIFQKMKLLPTDLKPMFQW